jgi:hypothetical protein
MSLKSVLDKIGTDVKDVFNFLGSPKGQALVSAGEGLVETVLPGTAGAINLGNAWLQEIIKTQAIATAASAGTGSSTQKAAMTITAITPQALAFAQANGLPAPTATVIANANNALVAFLNAFTLAPETTTVPVTTVPVVQTPAPVSAPVVDPNTSVSL